ncbi:MAG: inositol monophosphatase family protein, partial [Acidimicrobiales bacterium]
MSAPLERELLDFAVDVVRTAGEMTLRWFRSPDLAVDSKADGTPVTAADRAAERLVRERIAGRFPDDGVLGEEEPEVRGRSGRRWIVDPIDGTKAFIRGVPLYSTLLALHDGDGPALGVIGLPALGQVVYAGRGLGCWSDGR